MTGRPAARVSGDWLETETTKRVMAALGPGAVFVGGCVRNALLGVPVSDVDIATPLPPETVTNRLRSAGIKAVPTGIEHGTVTAVTGGAAFEVTTFRADVETDGRRAVVRFTTDMAEDARRRDFTMNALYADADGRVLDPLGGLPDLRARRVRFIGHPEDRIREDYLRILRFFRFTAQHGEGPPDPAGLDACAVLAPGMARLAHERIGAEARKLLAVADPAPTVAAMEEAGVLEMTLPGADAAWLPPLVAAERTAGAAPDALRRIVALRGADPGAALVLSRAEAKAAATVARLAATCDPPALMAEEAGAEAARSAALVRAAWTGEAPPADLEAGIARGAAAAFPLSAKDLIARGWRPGPALGEALACARARWRASDFALDRASLVEGLGPPPA